MEQINATSAYLSRKFRLKPLSQKVSLAGEIAFMLKCDRTVPAKFIRDKGLYPIQELYLKLKKEGNLSKKLFMWSAHRLPDIEKLGKVQRLKFKR